MRIGLIDVDGHKFPNLALMKLSSWHKEQGDTVEWHSWDGWFDKVYMAKVFSEAYTEDVPEPFNATQVIRGGQAMLSGWRTGRKSTTRKRILHCQTTSNTYTPITACIRNTRDMARA